MPAKKPTTTNDKPRAERAAAARGELPAAIYVTKRDKDGNFVGREKTIQVVVDTLEGIGIRGENVEVAAIVYDGNALEVARPVRLVLSADAAKYLIDDLNRFIRFIDVGAE